MISFLSREMIATSVWPCNIPRVLKLIFTFMPVVALCIFGCSKEEAPDKPEAPETEDLPSLEPPEDGTPGSESGGS